MQLGHWHIDYTTPTDMGNVFYVYTPDVSDGY